MALGIGATGWLAISAIAGAGVSGYSAASQDAQGRKSLRNQRAAQDAAEAQAAKQERQAMEAQQRAARQTPDLMATYDREQRKLGSGAPPLANGGPLSLGGNSLLGG